jgi:hypothetical protein
MKGKHYYTTTLSHPLSHTQTLSYVHTIKYPLLNYLLHITLVTYLLSTTQPTLLIINIIIKTSYIHIIKYLQFNLPTTYYYLSYLSHIT